MIQLDAPDPLRTPSLSVAARTGNADAIRQLLKEGRRPDNIDNRGWTPVHEAAAAGHVTCLVLLLRADRGLKDLRTHEGETPLFLSVNPNSKLDVMKILLNHSASVNLGNNEEVTPLHKACELGLIACARMLLDTGADVDAADADGNRPIQEAINRRSVELVNLLLEYGADLTVINLHGLTPLMSAAVIGFHDIVRKLDKPELHIINQRELSGRTALMLAAQRGCLETTKALLEMGADANLVSDDEQTALHLAAHGDNPRVVECLAVLTDVSVVQCTAVSPVILAIDSMQVESVELLLAWMNDHPCMLRKTIECQDETLNQMYRVMGAVSYLLYYKAEQEATLAVLDLLLRHGFSVDIPSKNEVPPLVAVTASTASKQIKKLFIEILLDHGADADQPCPWRKLSPLPAAVYYACHVHPDEKWLVRLIMSACKKCDPDTLLHIVLKHDREEQHPCRLTVQQLLNVALELGFSDQVAMAEIWRRFRRTGFTEEDLIPHWRGVLPWRAEQPDSEIQVPETLTPTSLSKLCRLVVRKHYSQSELKTYNLPSVICDFLNYTF